MARTDDDTWDLATSVGATATGVAVGRRMLPKAETFDMVRECLQLLSGRRHQVMTGVTVAVRLRQQTSVEVTEATLTRLDLHAALDRLGDTALTIIALDLLGHSYAETALLLDIPIGTVKSRHHRALAALRQLVDS